LQLGRLSFSALRRGDLLPILIFSSGFILLLNGQLGQPTTLGFAVILNGFCLAAAQSRSSVSPAPAETEEPAAKAIPRISPYASRLHGPKIGTEHSNGFADR